MELYIENKDGLIPYLMFKTDIVDDMILAYATKADSGDWIFVCKQECIEYLADYLGVTAQDFCRVFFDKYVLLTTVYISEPSKKEMVTRFKAIFQMFRMMFAELGIILTLSEKVVKS
jgi:hypothetical protein